MIHPTSNGRRRFCNGISSPRGLNCIQSISTRHRSLYPANIGMPISTFIKMIYLRRFFQFRRRYVSAVELSTSFQQLNSIVADIKTITKWHFHLGSADMNIDIFIEWPTRTCRDACQIANPRWRGKRSRHSRPMRNPKFYVSGTWPIG